MHPRGTRPGADTWRNFWKAQVRARFLAPPSFRLWRSEAPDSRGRRDHHGLAGRERQRRGQLAQADEELQLVVAPAVDRRQAAVEGDAVQDPRGVRAGAEADAQRATFGVGAVKLGVLKAHPLSDDDRVVQRAYEGAVRVPGTFNRGGIESHWAECTRCEPVVGAALYDPLRYFAARGTAKTWSRADSRPNAAR